MKQLFEHPESDCPESGTIWVVKSYSKHGLALTPSVTCEKCGADPVMLSAERSTHDSYMPDISRLGKPPSARVSK